MTACLTLLWGTTILLWTGALDKAEAYIENLIQIAGENSLAPYRVLGVGFKGELLVRRGDGAGGLRLLRESLTALRAVCYELFQPTLNATMAEGLMMLGQLDMAQAQIDDALASTGEGPVFNRPELLRVQGEVLAKAGNERSAEKILCEAIALADESGALSWRLRAATSLARLFLRQSRGAEARALLAGTYDRFREGFETADLTAARELLARIDTAPDA